MTKTIYGRIRGQTIELDEDPGVPEGQEVEVQVRAVQSHEPAEKPRRLGTMKGSVTNMSADFDEPLDELFC